MSDLRKVLITGGAGKLARALIQTCPEGIGVEGMDRHRLNILDPEKVRTALFSARPNLVINCASFNAVDRAETDEGREAAIDSNSVGVQVLAGVCAEYGVRVLHFSSDYVFDGDKGFPYHEGDPPNPVNFYGRTKLEGERAVIRASSKNFVVRVCRLFTPLAPGEFQGEGPVTGNFPLLMLRLARKNGRVRVVNDQVGSPSYTPDVARGVWELVRHVSGGLYHISNEGECDFASWTRELFELAGVDCPIESVSSAEYGAAARRPLYTTFENQKAYDAGVTPLRHWREAMAEMLASSRA
ncbi:MAG: dTDP-4-dehydrorhamnose reductase [Verrucomicrobiae bacterium]|nr:dTDP-4-dehydrorhamnose reductase [Verrucomicrobiae bacterium]